MRPAGLGMPPAIAERIELLHIAELDSGLPLHPFAQSDLERAVGAGREGTEGKRVPRAGSRRAGTHHQDMGLPLADRDDGGVKPELDVRIAASRSCA